MYYVSEDAAKKAIEVMGHYDQDGVVIDSFISHRSAGMENSKGWKNNNHKQQASMKRFTGEKPQGYANYSPHMPHIGYTQPMNNRFRNPTMQVRGDLNYSNRDSSSFSNSFMDTYGTHRIPTSQSLPDARRFAYSQHENQFASQDNRHRYSDDTFQRQFMEETQNNYVEHIQTYGQRNVQRNVQYKPQGYRPPHNYQQVNLNFEQQRLHEPQISNKNFFAESDRIAAVGSQYFSSKNSNSQLSTFFRGNHFNEAEIDNFFEDDMTFVQQYHQRPQLVESMFSLTGQSEPQNNPKGFDLSPTAASRLNAFDTQHPSHANNHFK